MRLDRLPRGIVLLLLAATCVGCVAVRPHTALAANAGFCLATLAPESRTADAAYAADAAVDRQVLAYLREQRLPGATLAFSRRDGSVHARAYGCADRSTGTPMPAQARLRIASVSKVLTAAAIMRLVEQGALDLDAPVLPGLDGLLPAQGGDPRLARITPRLLLTHCAGFDPERAGDPVFQVARLRRETGLREPLTSTDLLRWRLSQALDYTPGRRCRYANIGYTLLGHLIERIHGMPYQEAVGELLWTPTGVGPVAARTPGAGPRLGSSRPGEQGPDEPRYHADGWLPSVFDPDGPRVAVAYGAFDLALSPGSGGWVASAEELVVLVLALEGSSRTPGLLSGPSLRAMNGRPRPFLSEVRGGWYGFGRDRIRVGGRDVWWHSGDLPGSSSLLLSAWPDGPVFALLINGTEADPEPRERLLRDLLRTLTHSPAARSPRSARAPRSRPGRQRTQPPSDCRARSQIGDGRHRPRPQDQCDSSRINPIGNAAAIARRRSR